MDQNVLIYPKYSSRGEKENALKLNCRSVTTTPDSILTQSPVESGVFINDCKVRRPTIITMQVILEIDGDNKWKTTILALKKLHEQFVVVGNNSIRATKEDLAVVQTKESVYENMVLLNCPHTEGVDNFNTFEFTLKFQELMLVGMSAYSNWSPTNAEDNSVQNGDYKSQGL